MKFQLEKQKPDPLLHMNKKGDISPLFNMIWWKKVVLDIFWKNVSRGDIFIFSTLQGFYFATSKTIFFLHFRGI